MVPSSKEAAGKCPNFHPHLEGAPIHGCTIDCADYMMDKIKATEEVVSRLPRDGKGSANMG